MIWRRGQLRRGKICLNLMASVLLKEVFAWQMSRTKCSIALCTGKSKKCEWARVGPGITLWMSSSEPNKKEVFGCLRRDLYVTVLYRQTSNTVPGEFLGRLVLGVEDDEVKVFGATIY